MEISDRFEIYVEVWKNIKVKIVKEKIKPASRHKLSHAELWQASCNHNKVKRARAVAGLMQSK